MNSNCYKIIFSKRLGTLVAVGEHTTSSGKAASGQACRAVVSPSSFAGDVIDGFVGLLKLSFASVSLACLSLGTTQAQSNLPIVASTTLPQNGVVNQGSASISTHGAQMAITQTTDKASINWQSFSIGTAASVNIAQPSASSVLLNRVTGNDPSQILGKLSANGQLILLNPNGVMFGKYGSVTASAFTASTFGLNDADFMNGFYKYQRNGSTAAVVNQGTIEVSSGGFVALMGATVTNEGKIIAPQGDVLLAAAESVTLPEEFVAPKQTSKPNTISVRMGKRVRLELDPATINTAVNNTESGVIVTEGGQVLLQSAALSSAVASVTHSGVIDTSAPQAGAVTVLAENGNIKVDGTIKSNSTGNTNGTANRGGDIIIGRDEETGALSKSTDISAAKLESSQGFVETSGQHITVDGVQVKAAQWLLDPTDITITATGSGTTSSGTNPITLAPNTSGATASTVSVSTLESNLSAGTSVIVKTTNASGTGNGDITVASNIAVTGTTDATLTLQAERDIVVNSNVSIARTGTNKLNVVLNSDLDGNGAGAIVMNSGSSINSNGGNITLGGGTAGTGADYARGYTDATRFTGVSLTSTTLSAAGGDITIRGKGNATFTNSNNMRGVDLSGSVISTSGSGNITMDGVGGNGNISNTNVGVGITGASTVTGSSGGTVTLTGTGMNGANYNFGVWLSGAGSKVTSPGNINVTGTGGGSGSYGQNSGVMVQSSAAIRATGSGNLTVTGTGGDTTGTDNHGVQLASSGILSSANGNVTITGTSGPRGSSSFGVTIGSASQVTTTGGNVDVTATGQVTGAFGYGLWIGDANSKISVGDNGNATINAFSSARGSSDALGAQIRSVGAITTNNGNINFTGTSRGAAGNYNIGIGFSGGSLIAGGTGTVTLTATGGSAGNYAYGVSNANITTSGGAITINGISSSTGTGSAAIDATTSAMSTSGGNITMTGDSYSAGSTEAINAGSGTVTIQNRTAGTLIDVGATSADVISGSLKLGVSSAELARITAATVVIGRNDGTGSGNVNLSATNLGALGNTGGNLTVLSGNNIAINGAITKSTGTDATLTLNALNGIDISNAAASVGGTVAGVGKLNVAMTANGNAADVANSSGLLLTKVINANGGTVSLAGTNKKSTGGSSNSGVRLSGASIYAASLSVTGNQTGTNAGSDTNGIYISGTNTVQTTTGTSTLTGNSNAIGNFGGGIFFADSSSTTLDSGSGSISFSGLNSNTGYPGLRIGGSSSASINAKGNITFEDTGFQVMLLGQLTQQANTTVNFKGKGVSMYAGTSVVKAAGATGTTLNLEAQTVVVGDGGGAAALTADTINLAGNTTSAGTTAVKILKASSVTSSGTTTITSSGLGTSLSSDADTTIAATDGVTVNINNAGTLASQLTGGTANAGGLTKSGAGTLILTGNNNYSGTTTISAGTLQVGNGGTTGALGSGAVTLSNNANLSFVRSADTTISNAISGTGNVSSSITGGGSDLTVNGTINLTDGLINLAADGNMTVAAAVGTGNASSSAAILNAGKSTSAGASSGGDLILSGSGTVTVGSGGRATLMSGSVAGSTGLTALVGVGNSRYNSDELSTGYTQAIGSSGLYAIYRESPSLTVTLNNDSKTYNTLAYSGGNGYTVSSTVNGDAAASMGGSIVYGGTAQNAINAGTYTITGSGLTNSLTSLGYTLAYTSGRLTVGKAALVATANSGTATYNGYEQSLVGSYSVTGLLGSDNTSSFTGISSAGVTRKNAGSYTNTITVADQTNYTVSGVNGTYTIGKAALTATGNSSSVTYNASSQSVIGFTVSGLKGSDTVADLTGISAAGATATNAGSYSNAMTVVDQNNYTVTGVNGTLTIGKAALVATANSGSVTYNGGNQSISGFTVAGLLGSDTAGGLTGVSASGATAKDFGNYANTMTVADQTNYTVTGVNGTLSVSKANLTLSGTRVYDGGTSFAGSYLTASGVNSETFALTGSGDASNLSSKHVQSSIPLNSVTGLTIGSSTNGGISSNYNALTTTGSSVSVTARTATVSATPTTLTYNGGTQQQSAETSSGFISGDNITITGNASGKNANTYASNLSVTGADAGNYNITLNNANLVIDKAQLLVTASQATKTYDNSLSASGSGTVGTLAGASAGNAVSDNGTQAFLDKNAGINKTVRASGVAIKDASNADVTNNYDVVYIDNTTSSISKAALTVKANNDARFVTLSDTAGYNGVSYSGFVGGETNSVLGGTLSISRTNASTNVGAQTYTGVLVASGLTSNNYTIGYTNGNYTIVPAGSLLIRSANETLTYGTATPSFSTTAQYLDGSNVIHTLSRTGSGNNYTFSDGAGGSVAVQLKPYSGSGLATTSTSGNTIVGNYDIKDANPTIVGSNFLGAPVFVGVETVNTKPVTPNATNVSKVYDGSTSMNNVVVGFTGNITNDDLSITGNGAFSQKNVGQNLSYTISGISLSGADAANYTLIGGSSSFTGTNGTITPATLVISSSDVTKVYDRTSTAAGTAIAAQGTQVFGTDALSGGTFAFTDVNVGNSNKVVSVSGATVSDGNNGNNYVVSYVNNTTSTITPKALTASYTAANKAYDGNTTATVTGASSDIISGDTVSFSNTSATFDTKNSGLAKTVSVAGISISGSEAGNYSLQNNSATTTADITKKDVTLTAGNVSKTYDGTLVYSATPSDLTPFTSQLVSGDTATAAIISFANKNAGAGNKTVTLDHVTVSDGNSGGNYNLTLVGNTTSTITPAALTIKVNDTAMFVTQDANTATNQGFSYTGFKNGETATTALSGGALTISDCVYTGATNFPVAGSYTGVYGLNSGVSALNGNYTIAVQNGNLTVTPADKLLITIASQSEVYGTRTATNVGNTAAGTVTAEYCLSAVNCNGANLVSLTTTQLSNTQWKATDNTGSYVVFDTSTQTPTYSSGGYLNAGNYGLTATEIAPISLPNGNFTGRATNSGVLSITPRAVSTSASAVTKTYDGSTQQFGANVTIDNAALNDVVTLTANTSVYASKNVGNNIAVNLNALGLSGTDAANYYLPNSSVSTTGSITPKALSLTGSRVANKVFDGNTQATVTAVGNLQGLVGSEALGLANVEGTFNTPSVGTNKQVAITAVLQDGSNGGLASNYSLTPGSAYADITAASNGAESGRNIIVPPKPFIPSNSSSEQATAEAGGSSGGSGGGGSAGSNPYTVIPNNRRDSSADKCTATSLEACVCDAQGASAVDGVAICYQPQKAASNQTSKPRRI